MGMTRCQPGRRSPNRTFNQPIVPIDDPSPSSDPQASPAAWCAERCSFTLLTSHSPSTSSSTGTRDPDPPLAMERTVNSLAYKGSISDAINQSRQQKKLFVVYISGDDDVSSSLEQSTLIDEHVAEVIGRCCIFLHLKQGTVDAAQFSAIYPQKSVPSISVIGLNGVMLWNHEGYIISENLKESIEKAWAALHMQVTAMTLLTSSLASRNVESVNTSPAALPHQQVSSPSENPSASSSQSAGTLGVIGVAHPNDLASPLPSRTTHDEPLEKNGEEGSESVSDPDDRSIEKLDSACTEIKFDVPDSSRSSNIGSSSDPKPFSKSKNIVDGSCTEVLLEASPGTITTRGLSSKLHVEQEKAITSINPAEVSNSFRSDDIHLSIRMPNGNKLEIKLTKQDALREVKNFVDENLGSGDGPYDLSMIYPKRVFTEKDMEATLCELGVQNRHAMMVVPHRQSAQVPRPQSQSPQSFGSGENSGGGGYFSYLRTVLSYANPLSYLRGNPTSNPELQASEDQQQHRTSPGRSGVESQETTQESRANTLRRRTRPFGANVHTLGSDQQNSSDDRNVFWNGNSTEFGGDDRK